MSPWRDFFEFLGVMLVAVAFAIGATAAILIPIACIESRIPDATTIQHDGHRYVKFKNKQAVVHDPDCPCQHKTPEAE